jgi:hypothetical protein
MDEYKVFFPSRPKAVTAIVAGLGPFGCELAITAMKQVRDKARTA